MISLVVSCDCQEYLGNLGNGVSYSLQDFLDRKRWAEGVRVTGHKNGERVFVKAEDRKGVCQVAIERGSDTGWLCKHGLAALGLLGRIVRVVWEKDRAERMAEILERGGKVVRLFEVNGCVWCVCWRNQVIGVVLEDRERRFR